MDATLVVIFLFLMYMLWRATISALMAVVVWLLWNYIAVETHHPTAQISFWVAWAATFLVTLVAGLFQSPAPSK
jgi:type VI protein secretion system component VasK